MQPKDVERLWSLIGDTPTAVRFWTKVAFATLDDCWGWTGYRQKLGYGTFHVSGRMLLAHRVAWTFGHGAPPATRVLHRCDNRSCCNVRHLFLGSQSDNVRDMVSKGRNRPPRGEECHAAKLTPADVHQIRALLADGRYQWEIGQMYGVNQSTIWNIAAGRTWKSVPTSGQ